MISHDLKALLVHIPKTGGGSITKILKLKQELPQKKHMHVSMNFLIKNTAYDLSEYFSFTIVRNPYDKAVSSYMFAKFQKRIPEDMTFKSFFETSWLNKDDETKSPKYMINSWEHRDQYLEQHNYILNSDGKSMVNYIGRFETLQQDFNVICDNLNIPHKKLPFVHKMIRKPYWEYYDDEMKDLISEVCKTDIELFGYSFDNTKNQFAIGDLNNISQLKLDNTESQLKLDNTKNQFAIGDLNTESPLIENKIILVISNPLMGADILCKKLDGVPNVKCIGSLYGNTNWLFGETFIRENRVIDAEFVSKYVKDNFHTTPEDIIVIKLSDNQMLEEEVKSLLSSKLDISVLFVTRDLKNTYKALVTAQLTDNWEETTCEWEKMYDREQQRKDYISKSYKWITSFNDFARSCADWDVVVKKLCEKYKISNCSEWHIGIISDDFDAEKVIKKLTTKEK